MNGSYKWLFMFTVLFILLLVVPSLVHAQDPSDPSDPSGLDPAIDVDLPFDGGLFFLIAAGVGYGIKNILLIKRKKEFQS